MEPTLETTPGEPVIEELQDARSTRTLKDYAGIAARGFAMGSADVVPGVSGGTMAFILGIYEELIQSIREIAQPRFVKTVLRFKIKEALQILNWPFLLAVAIGILAAILTLAQFLEFALETFPVYVWSFFFGLVLASAWVVSKRITDWTPPKIAMVVVGAVGAYVLVGLVPAETPNAWWFLILSGSLAICAMILPGISGAFILVLLGKYEYVLGAVNDRDLVTVAFVGIGAVIGIVSFAQILGWLFKRYHDLTVAFLTGLMFGSLRKIWPWKADPLAVIEDQASRNILPELAINGAFNTEVAIAAALLILGFAAVIILERVAMQSQVKQPETVSATAK